MRLKKVENLLIIQYYLIVNFYSNEIFLFYLFIKDLTGCSDGSVYLLDWSQDSSPRQVREQNKRVTKIELSSEGNKVNKNQTFYQCMNFRL